MTDEPFLGLGDLHQVTRLLPRTAKPFLLKGTEISLPQRPYEAEKPTHPGIPPKLGSVAPWKNKNIRSGAVRGNE